MKPHWVNHSNRNENKRLSPPVTLELTTKCLTDDEKFLLLISITASTLAEEESARPVSPGTNRQPSSVSSHRRTSHSRVTSLAGWLTTDVQTKSSSRPNKSSGDRENVSSSSLSRPVSQFHYCVYIKTTRASKTFSVPIREFLHIYTSHCTEGVLRIIASPQRVCILIKTIFRVHSKEPFHNEMIYWAINHSQNAVT